MWVFYLGNSHKWLPDVVYFQEGTLREAAHWAERQSYLHLTYSLMTFQSENSSGILKPKLSKSDPRNEHFTFKMMVGCQGWSTENWVVILCLTIYSTCIALVCQRLPVPCCSSRVYQPACLRLCVCYDSLASIKTHLFEPSFLPMLLFYKVF